MKKVFEEIQLDFKVFRLLMILSTDFASFHLKFIFSKHQQKGNKD
jgi:hypothetical protein